MTYVVQSSYQIHKYGSYMHTGIDPEIGKRGTKTGQFVGGLELACCCILIGFVVANNLLSVMSQY